MSECDQGERATSVLVGIGQGIDELKEIVSELGIAKDTMDTERPKTAQRLLWERLDRTYKRMFRGSSMRAGCTASLDTKVRQDLVFPSEGWFRECILGLIKEEMRACRDIARSHGADNTADEINKRLI
jgi:hypothetical protein